MTHAFKTFGYLGSLLPQTPPPAPDTISSSIDLLFDLASSLGTRDKAQLNFEFKRNISVNMK